MTLEAAPGRSRREKPQSIEAVGSTPLDREIQRHLPEGIKAPPVKIHIELVAHARKQDAQGIRAAFEDADIFLPEGFGISAEDLEIYNVLSQKGADSAEYRTRAGDYVRRRKERLQSYRVPRAFWILQQFMGDNFGKEVRNMVSGSGKVIGSVDIKDGDPLIQTFISELRTSDVGGLSNRETFSAILGDDFDLSCKAASQYIASTALSPAQHSREQYMIDHLAPEIARLVTKYAHLRSPAKKELKVMMFLGARHISIPVFLQKSGNRVTMRSTTDSFPYYMLDGMQRAALGETISDEDGKRLVLTGLFEMMYLLIDKRKDNPFLPLHHHQGRALASKVFVDVFLPQAKQIWERFRVRGHKGELLRQLIAEKRSEIEAVVKKEVDVLIAEGR